MSGQNLTSSLGQLLMKYKQLPYITIKKNSRRYMIPHKPLRPKMIYFNIATSAIREHSFKYNQYFSPEKLWQKVSQKFQQSISDKEKTQQMKNEVEYKKNWDEYNEKLKEYNAKYKEPFKLMGVNSYCIFRREFYKKIREQSLKINNDHQSVVSANTNSINIHQKETNEQVKQQIVNSKKRKASLPYVGSQESIKKINELKVSQVWKRMSPQEKKVYEDQFQMLREESEDRIREFIKTHQVPVVKKYSTISRFIARYAAVYQLKLSDPALYQKYRQLPQQQKQQLRKQAIEMNREGKQRLSQFLKRWNISKQQLQYIILVSDKYEKTKKASRVESRRTNRKKEMQQIIDEEEEQQYDIDEYQEEDEDYTHSPPQQSTAPIHHNHQSKEHNINIDNNNNDNNNNNSKRS